MDAILVAAFALALLAPTIDLFARPASARSALRENREPWPYPSKITGFTTLGKFPSGFESWFDDRFGLRDRLLRANQWLRLFVLHSEASPTLVAGADGWLFFGADNSIPVQRGLAPLDEKELERWRSDIETRRDWLRARGIEYAFAIVPNKQAVYPERVPEELVQLGPTRLDQVTAWMRAKSDVRFVDLRDALLAEKLHDAGGDFAYYPLGSHWSWRGAWAGWNAIVASFGGAVPALRPIPREACALTPVSEAATDSMAVHTYIADLVHQPAFQFLPVAPRATLVRDAANESSSASQPDATRPATMVIHDSFGTWILPFAAESSSRMSSVWSHGFEKDAILAAQPDVVVQVYTERVLVWGLPELVPDTQLVDAAAFAAFVPLWGPLDLANGPVPRTQGGLRASRAEGGLALEMMVGNGVLELPPAELAPGAELALHVDITAPSATSLTVFYQLADDLQFKRSRAAAIRLAEGRNDLHFRVREQGVGGAIKLHVAASGAYVLHAIEARSAR
jgi:alginate O-acetyltransferase complex protein AlgJ